jgi:large subunit ribosomal protein L21
MYAVVEIAGRQYKVAANDRVNIPLNGEQPGTKLTFERVLLVGDDKKVTVGSPTVKGARVQATILEHGREDKIIVFKKKKRKGYRVTRGHRQGYTRVEINGIAV